MIESEGTVSFGGRSFKRHKPIKVKGETYTDRGWVSSKDEAEQIANFLRANNNKVLIVPSETGAKGKGAKVYSVYARYMG